MRTRKDKILSLQEMYVSLVELYKVMETDRTTDKQNRMANIRAVKNTTKMWKKQFEEK